MTTRRVLLLHGLWMRPASLALLARRLARAGFAPEAIGYASVRGGPAVAIRDLARAANRAPCHVVAHSLGGLVTLAALDAQPELPIQRVVCLGSPLCGSAAAHGLAKLPVVGAALGRSRELLREGCRPWQGRAQVGMVAGDRALGLGQVLGRFDGASDGTVAVAETRLAGLADHVVVPASHPGLGFPPIRARPGGPLRRRGRLRH